MKILQTGDLHLGKILYEYSLIEDQKHILNELKNILLNDEYDVLALTGDIYDRAVPSPEAVELFDTFLTEIHAKKPKLSIMIISGNHDSAKRLSFASKLLSSNNINICAESDIEKIINQKPITITDSKDFQCDFYLLPFVYAEDIKKFAETVNPSKEKPAILFSHCLTLGAETSSSERTFVGNAENLDSGIFSKFSYTGLGHIHKPQKVSEKIYYAGSPLPYSFDEIKYEKSFLKIEITEENPLSIEKIPANPLRKFRIIKDSFQNFLEKPEYKDFKDDYIEFLCTDSVLPTAASGTLKKFFPNLMTFQLFSDSENDEKTEEKISNEVKQKMFEEKESLPIKDVFGAFVKDIFGKDLTDYEKEVKILEKIASDLEKEE